MDAALLLGERSGGGRVLLARTICAVAIAVAPAAIAPSAAMLFAFALGLGLRGIAGHGPLLRARLLGLRSRLRRSLWLWPALGARPAGGPSILALPLAVTLLLAGAGVALVKAPLLLAAAGL